MLNNEMTAEDRAALKPGDRVWVGEYSRERVDLGVVTKTSRTRFSVAPNPLNTGYIAQYRIGDGYRYDRHLGGCVHYRATPAEVQEWEALKQREAAEREERERERQAIQDTGTALSALFADPVWVGHESEGQWNISNLTEAQVRVCAAALQSPPQKPSLPQGTALTYRIIPETSTTIAYTEYQLGSYVVGLKEDPLLGHCIPWIRAAREKFGIGLKEARDIWDRRVPEGEMVAEVPK